MQILPFETNISVYEMDKKPKIKSHGISLDVIEMYWDFWSKNFLIQGLSWEYPGNILGPLRSPQKGL